MSNSGLKEIKEQSQLPAPTLLPSPGLGKWLHDMNGSLLFSTYQSARIFFVSGAKISHMFFMGYSGILALGIILNTRTDLGVAAFTSLFYAFSKVKNISLGIASIILYLILIIVQICLVRKLTITIF